LNKAFDVKYLRLSRHLFSKELLLKNCDLCGIENPAEARFCMKCGNDLDKVQHSSVPQEMLQGNDSFIPMEDDEYARLGPTTRFRLNEPVGDVASYKEAAAASAAAWEAEEEQAAIKEEEAARQAPPPPPPPPAQAAYVDAPSSMPPQAPEIQRDAVRADFVEKKTFCQRCGMANPRDQRFCKNCGSSLAETGTDSAMADDYYETQTVDMAASPVETTTLADVSPSSAYSDAPPQQEYSHRRISRSRGVSLPDWGVREWLLLIAGALVLALLVWLFLGGGLKMFSGSIKNIHKAGATMEKLPGFRFSISAAFEAPDSQYPGSGQVLFETPDRTAWEISRQGPSPSVSGTLQIADKTWTGSGTWVPADPKTATGDITLMWRQFKSTESLPNQPAGSSPDCLHYKYRMDPTLMMTVLGLPPQQDVSDAVMEIWIDSKTFQVIRQTGQLYGAQINGARTHVTMVMDLAEAGKPYGIKPPQ
jgi:ribosomal protein L40E